MAAGQAGCRPNDAGDRRACCVHVQHGEKDSDPQDLSRDLGRAVRDDEGVDEAIHGGDDRRRIRGNCPGGIAEEPGERCRAPQQPKPQAPRLSPHRHAPQDQAEDQPSPPSAIAPQQSQRGEIFAIPVDDGH